MIISITESQFNRIFEHKKVTCNNCGWEWNLADGGDDPYTCHKCGHTNKEQEMDERSRSFAFTRKKRKFSEPERISNPMRYREVDRLLEDLPVSDEHAKWVAQFDKGAKSITCPNCRKKFTQTTHKKKKSLPICPTCGTHVQQDNKEGK